MEFFSCNSLFWSFSRLDPKLKISEESPNSWIPWHRTMVSTTLIVPEHYMPFPRGPTYGMSCNCPKASYIALRHYISCTNMYHMLPHAITCQLSKARHQVPLPKKYTCHCTKVLHVIAPRAKPLTGDISCNCPMATKAILLTLGTTCHCRMA